ncbi:MAG: methionyl-tRNA formyltransferase [Polyangiaceae bacterium]|nr:methionyl-tRNA formyltransferase [Polyangiaceae bacterium]
MRTLFFGTPAISVPAFEALTTISEVVGVVCQPDRPSGRGMKMRPPAVKIAALAKNIEVYQPEKVKDGALANWIREKNADLALVIAYGRILNREVLDAPLNGCLNLHASLLPEYRGAAPIQRGLMDGRGETGLCLMQMDEGMDTGDVLSTYRLPIEPEETAGSLAEKMGALAAEMTRREIPRFMARELKPTPQAHDAATYAPPITKDDSLLDLNQEANTLQNQIRGLAPRPGASCRHLSKTSGQERRLRIVSAKALNSEEISSRSLAVGEVDINCGRLLVGCGKQTCLEILEAQLEGKKCLGATDLVNGRTLSAGDRLSSLSLSGS